MIGGLGGELGRRRDGDVRRAHAAGARSGFRVVYPKGGGPEPVAPRQPAADEPRETWAAPSDGGGAWCVGRESEREPAAERTGSGAARVVFLLAIAAAAVLQCLGAR